MNRSRERRVAKIGLVVGSHSTAGPQIGEGTIKPGSRYPAALLFLLVFPTISAAQRPAFDLTVGYARDRGVVLAGYDDDGIVILPGPRPPLTTAFAIAQARIPLGMSASLSLGAHAAEDSIRLANTFLEVHWRGLGLWAGRRENPLTTPSHSLVLDPITQFDGAGIRIDSAFGFLRVDAFGARMHHMGNADHPFMIGIRLSATLHQRLELAATRAAALGGRGNARIHIGDVPRLLIGLGSGEHGETENQVASLEARWRVPGPSAVTLYGEWALDDLGFAFIHVPGLRLGAEVRALRVEAISFAGHCCGNPPWYRHSALPWLENRSPLGHALGGHGRQLSIEGTTQLWNGRAHLNAAAFARMRDDENIYAPLHGGRSNGFEANASARIAKSFEPFGYFYSESGKGWRETRLRTGLTWRY